MHSSLLRMAAGYSRLAVQEERKHNNVVGSIVNAYYPIKKFKIYSDPIEGMNSASELTMSFRNLKLPSLGWNSSDFATTPNIALQNVPERVQNKTDMIQYQANNGIQDRLVVDKLKTINADTISVFDGHGGDKLSDYCSNHIVDHLDTFLKTNIKQNKYVGKEDQLICDALKYAYQRIQNDFYNNIYIPQSALNNRKIKNIGTCALTLIVYNKKVYVANCGDSEALLVSRSPNRQIIYTELNQRFSVSNPLQRERLAKQFPEDSDIIVQEHGGSYYVKGRLQPTRSLGDYYLKNASLFKGKGKFNGPYIQSQPQIKIFELNETHQRIVVASDGVWDFLDKRQVAQASLVTQSPQKQILDKTLERIAQIHKKSINQIMDVHQDQKRAFHDDISVAVISLGSSSKNKFTL